MKTKRYISLIIVSLFLAALDQLTKYFVVKNFELGQQRKVIGDAVVLTYIRNTGTAWSLLSGKTILLLIVTVIVMALLVYIYNNIITYDRYNIVRYLIMAVMGGAIGNMIDRVRLQYVVDFIYFKIINFPVFNVADIFVTVSIFILMILFIFKYKTEDIDVILNTTPKES